MAQDGDTITYTFSDGTSVAEDVSAVDTAIVNYCNGASGGGQDFTGQVKNAEIDVSGKSTLYVWVGGSDSSGRYNGGSGYGYSGGGSTEVSFSNTDSSDSSDEPFLVAAAGTGSQVIFPAGTPSDGARGRYAEGTPPPAGTSAGNTSGDPNVAEGAIDDQNRGFVSGGTVNDGGGGSGDGEVKITYQSGSEPPAAPSNLSAEVQ